jgi:membrane-associated phospholipid phosphatase
MDTYLQWGMDLIAAIQQIHGPALDGVFLAITLIGAEEFYLVLVPLLFWCVDCGLGARLAILFLLSSCLNVDLKDLFQQPRPFDFDPSVQLAPAEGYGLPSGHSQSAVVVWGSLAAWTRKTWLRVVAIVLMVLIGFSRVYLGVHFPTDVLAGWTIGALLLIFYMTVQPAVEKRVVELSLYIQILLALTVPLMLLLIHPVESTTATMAALAGAGVGLVLTHRYVSFSVGGPWWQRVARFLIGGTVIFALYLSLMVVVPDDGSAFYLVFIHYGIIGVWISLGAPWLFQLLRI